MVTSEPRVIKCGTAGRSYRSTELLCCVEIEAGPLAVRGSISKRDEAEVRGHVEIPGRVAPERHHPTSARTLGSAGLGERARPDNSRDAPRWVAIAPSVGLVTPVGKTFFPASMLSPKMLSASPFTLVATSTARMRLTLMPVAPPQ